MKKFSAVLLAVLSVTLLGSTRELLNMLPQSADTAFGIDIVAFRKDNLFSQCTQLLPLLEAVADCALDPKMVALIKDSDPIEAVGVGIGRKQWAVLIKFNSSDKLNQALTNRGKNWFTPVKSTAGTEYLLWNGDEKSCFRVLNDGILLVAGKNTIDLLDQPPGKLYDKFAATIPQSGTVLAWASSYRVRRFNLRGKQMNVNLNDVNGTKRFSLLMDSGKDSEDAMRNSFMLPILIQAPLVVAFGDNQALMNEVMSNFKIQNQGNVMRADLTLSPELVAKIIAYEKARLQNELKTIQSDK